MSAWRTVGLNYINYSNIAANILRRTLKQKFQVDAGKRNDCHVKFTKWAGGKAIKN